MHQLLVNAKFLTLKLPGRRRGNDCEWSVWNETAISCIAYSENEWWWYSTCSTCCWWSHFWLNTKYALKLCEEGFKFLCKRNGGLQKFDAIFMFYASVMKKRNGQGKLYYINLDRSYIFVLCQMLLFCEKLVNSSAQSLGGHTVRRWSDSGWMGTTKQCRTIYSTLTDIIHFWIDPSTLW